MAEVTAVKAGTAADLVVGGSEVAGLVAEMAVVKMAVVATARVVGVKVVVVTPRLVSPSHHYLHPLTVTLTLSPIP